MPSASVMADDPLVRTAISMLLEREGITVEEAGDVIVRDGIRDLEAGSIVLVDDARAADQALLGGARGVLPRGVDGAALAAAVVAVSRGLLAIDPALTPVRAPRPPSRDAEELTPREDEVLQHLAAGLSNKEIAAHLSISEHTVKFHVNAVLAKLGAESRTEAVVRGVRLGLVIL
jgi:DNA-binding NarL/FixJ family response regulator